jgi:DNA (cytosine-5)-methyltransferase 1
MAKKVLKAIDLFAGIGGMRLGFEKAGFETVYANDIDDSACQTYEANFGKIDNRDIESVGIEEIPNFDVLLAGFPCQPFSMIGKRDGLNDKRGKVFFQILKVLNGKKPMAFLLENVKYLKKHNDGKTFEFIKKELENAGNGYNVFYDILDSKNFGVPQHRERIYIVGIKKSIPVTFTFPQKAKRLRKKFIRQILEKNVLENYYLSEKYYTCLVNHKERHAKKGSGFGFAVLDSSGISNTLVSGNMGRERNLIQDVPCKKNHWGIRKLTERECARLQGFPDSFKIPVPMTQAYKQFGNAVSVPVVAEIARNLIHYLQ